jgi:membrane protease subunit HflK
MAESLQSVTREAGPAYTGWHEALRRTQLRLWHVPILVLLILILDFALTGIWVVQQNEQGVVLRFGRAVRTQPAGMHFTLPYPIETVRRVRTTEVRTLPVGFTLQERLGALRPAAAGLQWLTGNTNIVEIRTVVQYRGRTRSSISFGLRTLVMENRGTSFCVRLPKAC